MLLNNYTKLHEYDAEAQLAKQCYIISLQKLKHIFRGRLV